jgi:hypothetical protein
MVMHPQLLADFNTIGELIDKFSDFEFPSKERKSGVSQRSLASELNPGPGNGALPPI